MINSDSVAIERIPWNWYSLADPLHSPLYTSVTFLAKMLDEFWVIKPSLT